MERLTYRDKDGFPMMKKRGGIKQGGVALMAIVLGLAVYAAGLAWIAASNKWRDILRAESLIYEYRMNRKAYIEWRERENKAQDNGATKC